MSFVRAVSIIIDIPTTIVLCWLSAATLVTAVIIQWSTQFRLVPQSLYDVVIQSCGRGKTHKYTGDNYKVERLNTRLSNVEKTQLVCHIESI